MLLPFLAVLLTAPSLFAPSSVPAQSARLRPLAPQGAEILAGIDQGRARLDAGEPVEAEALLARAAERDGGRLRTRMWVLRAWMDLGRSDEVLAELDALDHAGVHGIEMSYLYGMAFAVRAQAAVESGQTDAGTGMLLADAVPLLRLALEADAPRFVDAALVLARAAWQTQDLDLARWAADLGVARRPDWRAAWLQRGRVALSQFVVAEGEEAGSVVAESLWQGATDSFRRALELCEAAGDAVRAAESATGLAHALLWRERAVEATAAFATAIAWAPESHDFAGTQRLLSGAERGDGEGPLGFRAAVEEGRARFEARVATEDARLASLDWWLGLARFLEADWRGAEAAFQACLARSPGIVNAWCYVALARAYEKDSEGALAAMRSGCEGDGPTMVAALSAAGGGVRAFEGLIGWCATQEPARNLDAAFLADLLTQAFPDEPRHWNNLGLFLRDEGERLEISAHRRKEPRPDEAMLADLYERSFVAYQRALALTPDDPQVLNDTALMLQYHLERDRDQVEAMYRRSIALSEERLADPGLSPGDRERFETTLRDATGNLKLLLESPQPENAASGVAQAAG